MVDISNPSSAPSAPVSSSNAPVRTLTPPTGASSGKSAPQGGAPVPPQGGRNQLPPKSAVKRKANFSSMPFWIGLSLSILWFCVVAMALMSSGASSSFAGIPMVNWAIGISAIVSPVGLIWMVTAYLQRAADVQSVVDPLRRQLMMITGESGAAEARIRRFNQAIREQIELLRSSQSLSQNDLIALMDRVRQHKNDLEQFEQHSVYQVKEIQEVIRRSMQHVDQLLEDKFTMLRILDGKLVQSGDEVARQTESVREQLSTLLQELEANAHLITISIERASRDGKKLADIAQAQERSLVTAAETATGTLHELSGKIDHTIASFLERVGSAREEAERIGGTLEAQTKTLEDISKNLPARVGETEEILRSITDRLHASEQLAREQASQLSERLSAHVDGLQNLLDRFNQRLVDIDGSLQQRRSDLDGLVVRISGATDDLAQKLESSITGLGERAQNSLRQFAIVNEEARKGADEVANHMMETSARYEAAIRQLNALSEGNSTHLRSLTQEIATQLAQFEAFQASLQRAGDEIQSRSSSALQNLQHVLERLLATRDATVSVGETLSGKLRQAIEHNEHVMTRINEAAKMSMQALSVATDSLVRKEGEIATQGHMAESALRAVIAQMSEQARAAESAMREQNTALISLMREAQERMENADRSLQEFAARAALPVQQVAQQLEQVAAQGSAAMDGYSGKMLEQIGRLQQINARVVEAGEEATRTTSDTLSSLEQFNNRFLTMRAAQEETARRTLDLFAEMADRLQKEVGTLGDHTTQAVSTLQGAAAQVGEQSRELLREAQDSGAKIQIVTSALQNEAAQIRAMLQKQADDLNADLERAERQFIAAGESLKLRTDAAYSLLDRMAAHYNEATRAVAEELESRAAKLGQTAAEAHEKVSSLSSALAQQASQIANSAVQMESQSVQLVSAGGKTLQQLSALNEKLAVTQEATMSGAQNVIARLEETNSAMMRQSNSLSDAAQNAAAMIQKAGASFGEQASKMIDTTHQVETSIRGLNAATTAFADQTAQIRSAMDQHNQRLLASLTETVAQLDGASLKLQGAAAMATKGVDEAAERFGEVTGSASSKLEASSQELLAVSAKAESVLGALGASITQQVASLNIVSEQLSEQHRTIAATNENHRAQLLDLFEKLGAAHSQASEVAERTISRLADALQQIHRQCGALSDQSQTALADVRAAGTGFADQAVMLLQNAQQAEQQARTVLSVTAALQDQARQLREALHAEGERTSELLGTLLGKLGSGNSEMRELSSTAEMTLTSMQNQLSAQTAALASTMQQIADKQRSLTTALDAQRDVMNGLLNRLALAQDETAIAGERSASRLAESSQQIVRQMELIETQAENTLNKIKTASLDFVTEASALSRNAEQAEQLTRLLCASAATLQEQTRNVRESMQGETERLGEMLGVMLEKISSSASTLQELSTTTGARLSGLQAATDEQTSAIGAMMSQISERQRSLLSSLESQREIMTGLINRLALAQDETAASAERNIARLAETAQQITRQIEAIDSQAQNALANVRAVTAGFADEAGALNLSAQQTEQQARGLLSITAGMQDQARQLREAMQAESAQVLETLNAVITKLDLTSQQLKQHSGSMLGSMDQSVLQITSLASTTGEALQKHAAQIADVAEKAESRVLEAGEKIRSHFKVLEEAGDQAESQAKRLADTAEHATSRLAALRDSLAESDTEGRALLDKASQRVEEIRTALQRELDHVAEISQLAVQQVAAAGQALITQSDSMRANLAASESAISQAADLLRVESRELPAVLDRSAEHIESTRKTFAAQASEIGSTLVQTADRFIGTTGAARDAMMDEMRNLNETAIAAEETLNKFNQALKDQIELLRGTSMGISEDQASLVERSLQTIAQLTAASERLAQVRNAALQTTDKLAREFESIETMATSTTQRLSQAGENLGKQITQMAQMAERTEGQISSSTQGFREQMERIRSGVQMQIDDINRGLMQITAQLERTGSALRSVTTGTVTDIEKITSRLDQATKDTSHQLTDRTARMRVATEEVAKLLGGFGDQMDVLLSRLAVAGDGIKRHESDLIGRLQTALSSLGTITERLESGRLLTADVADETVSRLSEVSSAIESQLKGLKQESDKIINLVQGLSIDSKTSDLNRGLSATQEQISAMTAAIDEMQRRADRIRVALKLQADDLMNTLGGIMHQLGTAGDLLGEAAAAEALRRKTAEQGNKTV